jgi:signal transduction histidine kinase
MADNYQVISCLTKSKKYLIEKNNQRKRNTNLGRFEPQPGDKSLVSDFLIYSKIIIAVVVLASLWFSVSVYRKEQEHVLERMNSQAIRFDKILNDSIDYVAYLGGNIGNQIIDQNLTKASEIANLLSSYRLNDSNGASEVLTFTMLNWADANGNIIAGNLSGVINQVVSINKRSYAKAIKQQPWKLHISEPDTGLISGRQVIPGAIGVTNKAGEYIGAVVFAIDLQRLANRFQKANMVEGLAYSLIYESGKIFMEVPAKWLSEVGVPEKHPEILKDSYGVLQKPDLLNLSSDYILFQRSEKYPFIAVVSMGGGFASKMVYQVLLPRILEFTLIGLFLIFVLNIIKLRLIDPVASLSDAAEKISRGEIPANVANSKIIEIESLTRYIGKIGEHLRERKIVERELIAKTDELKLAKETAEQASHIKSDFLAFMSHEIRTPLNAMLAFSEIMSKQVFGPISHPKYVEYAADIYKSGNYLLSIINDLLDISYAETGSIKLFPEYINIREVAEDCLKIIENRAVEKSITMKSTIAENLPEILLDEVRTKQIILNLLSNSIKFTPEKGRVSIDINLASVAQRQFLQIIISDTGIGISEDDMPVALTKFGQTESGRKMNRQGVGLGLPIAVKLTEIQNGRLEIASKQGDGTKIIIQFPEELFRV